MSAANNLLIIAAAVAAAACGAEPEQPANNVAGADIEALPADESAATTSEELANGVNEPDVGNLGNQH